MRKEDLENFRHTQHYTDPKLRYFHGHFITGLQFKEEVIE